MSGGAHPRVIGYIKVSSEGRSLLLTFYHLACMSLRRALRCLMRLICGLSLRGSLMIQGRDERRFDRDQAERDK